MGRGGIPAREISFVSVVAYGPNSDSALIMGDYSLCNQAGRFPTAHDSLYFPEMGGFAGNDRG